MPHGHYQATTIIAAVRLKGARAPWLFGGALDGELFLAWVKQELVTCLQRDDVVIMDNLATHKVAGARLEYLPPYSPDFNPIENLWNKVKAGVKKSRSPHRPTVVPHRRRGLRPRHPPKTATDSFYTPKTLHDCWNLTCWSCRRIFRHAPGRSNIRVSSRSGIEQFLNHFAGRSSACRADNGQGRFAYQCWFAIVSGGNHS